jgi:hypothetical protein
VLRCPGGLLLFPGPIGWWVPFERSFVELAQDNDGRIRTENRGRAEK